MREFINRDYPEHLPEFVIALGTGQRKGNQFRLEWPHVNFEPNELYLYKMKNGDSVFLPMNSDVVAAFRSLVPGSKKPSGRIFPVLDPKSWFESARAKAGIKDFHWHDLRHSFCSRLAMAGVPLKTIQVLAGHKTISVTAKYAHLCPNTLSGAVEKITSKAWAEREHVQNQVRTATATATKQKTKKDAGAAEPQRLHVSH